MFNIVINIVINIKIARVFENIYSIFLKRNVATKIYFQENISVLQKLSIFPDTLLWQN